jgi:hypothetical protein
MRIAFICVLSCLYLGVFAQKSNFEIVTSPLLPFVPSSDSKFVLRDKAGISLGGHYLYNLKKNLWLLTGVEYSAFQHTYVHEWNLLNDPGGGPIQPKVPIEKENVKEIALQIPVLLRIEFTKKKHKPFIQGGLLASFALYHQEYLSVNKGASDIKSSSSYLKPFERKLLGGKLSAGLNFPLKTNKSLSVSLFGSQSAIAFEGQLIGKNRETVFGQLGFEVGIRF